MQSLLFLTISALMISNILSFIKIDAIVDTKFSPMRDGITGLDGEAIKCDLCGDTCYKVCTNVVSMDGLENFRRCCASYFKKRSPTPPIWSKLKDYQLVIKALKEQQMSKQSQSNAKQKIPHLIKWKMSEI